MSGDVHSPERRSFNMSRIRCQDTKPELVVRRALYAAGLRYRLHGALPGKPDIVFGRRRAVVFVHGCFWHGHDCPMFKVPATRQDFWVAKISANQARDARVRDALLSSGWRVMTVWECAVRGRAKREPSAVAETIRNWLDTTGSLEALSGDWTRICS